jgi:hypothetical protein
VVAQYLFNILGERDHLGRQRLLKCFEMNDLSELLTYSLQAGERVLARRHQRQRKELGQFLAFKSFLSDVAWDTEVWLAEMPDHLIHYNGDRFLGPRG